MMCRKKLEMAVKKLTCTTLFFSLILFYSSVHAAGICGVTPPPANNNQNLWEAVPLRSQAQQAAGFPGGEGMQIIFGLSYALSNPNILYLVSDTSQVWKSIDGGATWEMKHRGFLANGGISLAVDPANENIVFVAGSRHSTTVSNTVADGIYRTMDGGETWELVRITKFFRLGSRRGGVNFAFSGTTVYAGTHEEGILKSTDGGGNWTPLNVLPAGKVLDIKVHPQNSGEFFVATENALYKVTDGVTASAVVIGADLPESPGVIVIDSTNPDTIYAAVGAFGVYKSTNGGINFSPAKTGLPNGKTVTYLAISSANPDKLFVSLFSTGGNHPYFSHNKGLSWVKPTTMDEGDLIFPVIRNRGGPFYGGPIAPHPYDEDKIIASAVGNHIESTTDAGVTWRYSSDGYSGGRAGLGHTSYSWDPGNANRFAFFLIDFGPVLTLDGGATFLGAPTPRYLGSRTTPVGALDPSPGSNKIVTVTGKWNQQVIAVSQDEGLSWELMCDQDGNNTCDSSETYTEDSYRFIAFNPQDPTIIYAGKYKSTDGGTTWNPLSRKVAAMYAGDGNIVYATEMAGTTLTIYKSIDGGETWPTSYPSRSIGSGEPKEITVDPVNPDRVYVTALWNGIHIFDGNAWQLKNDAHGLEPDCFNTLSTHNIVVDPNYPNVVYAGKWITFNGQSNGVFRSLDSGDTWTNITANLGPEFTPWALSINPHDGYIYLGSSHGTWKLPPPYSDADGDGILSDGDWSGVEGDNGCSGGSTLNCDDNCPALSNADQANQDGDVLGNACDAFIVDPAEWLDTDGDGVGNNADSDDDGDGLLDVNETNTGVFVSAVDTGTDPLIADTDGDGVEDGLEVAAGTDPLNNTSAPVLNDGDANNDGLVNAADLVIAIQILSGQRVATSLEFAHLDVAPLVGGTPSPDGQFTLGDYLVLQRKVIGIISF
ncbi:MAG: hypothetical protein V3W04_06495 [Gammaproteobacteria bacterium]